MAIEKTANVQAEVREDRRALRSPWKMAWRKLRRHKLAMIAMWILIALHLFAIFADFFAPYSELTTDRRRTYHPPTKIHIFHEGKLVRPFVYAYNRVDTMRNIYEEDTSTMYPIHFFVRGDKYSFLGIETDLRLFGVEAPGKIYLMGRSLRAGYLLPFSLWRTALSLYWHYWLGGQPVHRYDLRGSVRLLWRLG